MSAGRATSKCRVYTRWVCAYGITVTVTVLCMQDASRAPCMHLVCVDMDIRSCTDVDGQCTVHRML